MGPMLPLLAWFATGCSAIAPTVSSSEPLPGTHETPVEAYAGTTLYEPAHQGTHAAIVVLHGSEGGASPFSGMIAQHFVEQGHLTATFCWFGCEGTPSAVQRVPLERLDAFLAWFHDGPAKGHPVVLFGASRGAELALLAVTEGGAAPYVDGVAVHAPTDTVVAAYDPRTRGPVLSEGGYDAAWTLGGTPLYGERAMPFGSGPAIPVERYSGPVLLSHGTLDRLWPVERSHTIEARRAQHGLRTDTVYWPDEGHIFRSEAGLRALDDAVLAFADSLDPVPSDDEPPTP